MTRSFARIASAALAIALLAALLGVLAAPEPAAACAVCTGNGSEASQSAYRISTAALSALPLLIFGGGAIWLFRRARRLERAHASDAAASLTRAPDS